MGELISCLAGNTYRATPCSDSVPRTSLSSRGRVPHTFPPSGMCGKHNVPESTLRFHQSPPIYLSTSHSFENHG
jgi:hypothetical protein